MADSRAALDWTRRHGAVGVLMSESKADDAPRRFWKEWVKRWYVSRFDAALCGGTPHRRYLEQLGMAPSRIFDKYDVVDNAAFADRAARVRARPEDFRHLPGLGEATPFFFVSSRFIPRKNVERLLRAYAAYRREVAEGWRLVLVGTGGEEAALRELVQREGIPGVTFAGFHQMDSLVAYYALASAFIHPALQEQWGLVVNEAMACGLPVLVSRVVGAAHDLVKDGVNGFTFDPSDAGQLALLMAKLSDSRLPLAEYSAASRRIIAEWTPEHFGRNFCASVAVAGRAGRRR
jgi:glycosyltransferase involved in cell wall biosynthesis